MSHEVKFARRLCDRLDQGNLALDPAIAERLRAARIRAIERQCGLSILEMRTIGAGGTALLGRIDGTHPWRTLFLLVTVLLGMSVAYYWNGFEQASKNEEIDSALLADDLPPKAYLDPGFQAWLSHYAHSAH